ncbi:MULTISPECIES: hypothetical protein [unclassified Knoellia]|uniref:hypothetical protein n=1 Tax=Knoellia altitudinis TaxID=3404795 RepID=UPI0036073C87
MKVRTTAFVAALFTVAAALLAPPSAVAATAWVDYPFYKDTIPVYNTLRVVGTTTAAHRWEVGTGIDLVPVSSEPSRGITIRWSSARAHTSVGGWVEVPTWLTSGPQRAYEIGDCIVNVNTHVRGVGRPYGTWLAAIVSHEVAHCLGHWDHATHPHIMRPFISKSETLAGRAWTPTATDLARIRTAYTTN